jgi:outer membrane protein OmpA-like peptidoglycan-associated protein
MSCALLLLSGAIVAAQSSEPVEVEGIIKAREGNTMILQTSESSNFKVVLTDETKVGQVQGLLQARRKDMSMAALIPGLRVKVKGTNNEQHELVAESVAFKGNDLERAETIQAGLHETQTQAQEHQEQISANKAAISQATARFGQLDDYYIRDEVTIYFENGKVEVDPKYVPQLVKLAENAKSIDGYVIEVKGYASAVGSEQLNQKLSEDRADNVTNILVQQGNVPLTRMLAPAAMGESRQIETGAQENEQAENRRVVVRVLQNKAIAGKQ